MKVDGEPTLQFLQFWRVIPAQADPEMTAAWAAKVADDVRGMPDDVVDAVIAIWRSAHEDTSGSLASVRGRASNLLLAVGILAGLGAVTATASAGLPWYLATPIWISAAVVAYFALGTSVLAIRAQQVRVWSEPHVRPTDASSLRQVREKHAIDLYVADRRNRIALADVVGYLRTAQLYALTTLAGILVMALMTVATAPFKPAAGAYEGTTAAPSSSASTESASPDPEDSIDSPPAILSPLPTD